MPNLSRLAGGFAAPHNLSPQPVPHLHVVTPPGCPPEVRLVTSPDSALVVGTAPVTQSDHLLRHSAFRARPLTYLLLAPTSATAIAPGELYVGETIDGAARFAKHRRNPALAAETVVLIACLSNAFGRDAIQALQHGLTAQARRAGRSRIVGAPPPRSWLQLADPDQLARWLAALRPMLVAAGCSALEPPGMRLRPRLAALLPLAADAGDLVPDALAAQPAPGTMALPAVQQGYRLDLPPGLAARPDAQHYTLAFAGVRAEAVRAGSWTVLRAGSRVILADDSSIQICLSRKRQALAEAGVLRPCRRHGLLQVTRDVALPSLTNAGRVVTGTNLPRTIWAAA